MKNNQINSSGTYSKYYNYILATVATTTLVAGTAYHLLFQNKKTKLQPPASLDDLGQYLSACTNTKKGYKILEDFITDSQDVALQQDYQQLLQELDLKKNHPYAIYKIIESKAKIRELQIQIDKDNEKQVVVKLLDEVVTLGKSHMVKYLADHAHSKDIEYIRSIEPIKDAYRVFLDKGFGYTKIFLRGIKKNFTFDSLSVARDFDELVHIDTTFRKKTSQELLASSEWKNLGNDTTDYLINIDEKKAEDQRILPIENKYNSLEGVPDQDLTGLIGHLED